MLRDPISLSKTSKAIQKDFGTRKNSLAIDCDVSFEWMQCIIVICISLDLVMTNFYCKIQVDQKLGPSARVW